FYYVSVGIALAGVPSQKHKTVVPEQQSQDTNAVVAVSGGEHGFEGIEYGGDIDGHDDGGKSISSSNGAELTSLAHSSAIQAKNAVQNQRTAGSQAAFGIKSSFASAALGAAQTAQAALVGKRAIVQNLKKQVSEAQHQLQEEIVQYQQTEAVVQATLATSQQAQEQLHALTAAVAGAQSGAQAAEHAAAEAANVAAAQQAMVSEAKQRLAHLLSQLHTALGRLQETEVSAYKAAEAAQVAQSNAAAAGLAVAAASAQGSQAGGSSYHHH
ncbi:hypothetical protein NQ315_009317, partial [Exocentrus adspersus]